MRTPLHGRRLYLLHTRRTLATERIAAKSGHLHERQERCRTFSEGPVQTMLSDVEVTLARVVTVPRLSARRSSFRAVGEKRPNRRESGDPSKQTNPRSAARRPILGPSGFDYSQFPPEASDRRSQVEYLVDKVLHGTPDGRVDPAISENLRHHLAANRGDPERALLNHLNEQMAAASMPMDAVFPEDLEVDPRDDPQD
jgi:hypothetical protein